MKHQFNTGRAYTDNGQVVTAEVAEGRIWFHDESRGIAGSIEYGGSHMLTKHGLETLVLTNYDFGNYRPEQLPRQGEARRV